MKNQQGFALLVPLVIAVVAIGAGGTVAYKTHQAKQQEAQLKEEAQEIEKNLKAIADSRNEIEAKENQENNSSQSESAPPTPEPSPDPNPEPQTNPEPSPEQDLYNSPKDDFMECPNGVTAYVVNKSGAPLYKNYGDAYEQTNPAKHVAYKTTLKNARCQDGDAVGVTYNGEDYVALPKDIRKTKPE